jgi:hypothetical protein
MAIANTNLSILNLAAGDSNQSIPFSTSFRLLGLIARNIMFWGVCTVIYKNLPAYLKYRPNACDSFDKADLIAMYKVRVANELIKYTDFVTLLFLYWKSVEYINYVVGRIVRGVIE